MLTLRELAKYLKIHYSTAYRLANKGELPGFKVGERWRFKQEDVDLWRMEQEKKNGGSSPQNKDDPNSD